MATECTFNLADAIVSLAGVGLGGLVGYLSARRISAYESKRIASAKLRGAFAPEIAKMRTMSKLDRANVEPLLESAFTRHSTEIEAFAFHLSGIDKEQYYKAWENYYCVGKSIRFFDYYMGENPLGLFLERVNAILAFTET